MKPLTLASAAAGLAAAAHAFAVVPAIAPADEDILNALPFDAPAAAQSRSVSVSCPGCPVQWRHHGQTSDVASHLELTFTVDEGAAPGSPDRLLLNDFELYPEADPWHGSLTAPQVLDFLEAASGHPHPRGRRPRRPRLGFSLAAHPVAREEAGAGQQLELVDVELQILEVAGVLVDGIPAVRARLIRTPSGKLMMAALETLEQPLPGSDAAVAAAPGGADAACETMICRWRAFVRAHMQKVKAFRRPCGAHKQRRPNPHGNVHHHHKTGGAPAVHNHYHSWRQLFKNITSYILMPILIGIVAGVSLSIIGMMVGTLAVCVWRVVVRRQAPWTRRHCRRRGHSCSKNGQAAAAAAAMLEKSGLIKHQEPPPEYDASPDAAEEQQSADAKV